MATVVGLMETAKALLPNFVTRLKTTPFNNLPAQAQAHSLTSQQMRPALSLVIDEIVLPHLIDAHRDGPSVDQTGADVDQLALLAMESDAVALFERVDVLLEQGFAIDTILVDVLAPVARRMGKMWDDDECGFVDVTLGLWRLQEVVRDLSARTQPRVETGYTALFVPFPGEQHSFGTVMIEDVFRRDGWDTTLLLDAGRAEIIDAVARHSYNLIGLTVSCEDHRDSIAALVSAVRAVSRNPRLCVMLGGRLLANEPSLITQFGADCTAPDAQQAVEIAARLVAANACREVFTA